MQNEWVKRGETRGAALKFECANFSIAANTNDSKEMKVGKEKAEKYHLILVVIFIRRQLDCLRLHFGREGWV
jgi:hypothetical protein